MWIRSTCEDIVIAPYLGKLFAVFHLGIIRADVNYFTIITHEGFQVIAPLYLCCHSIYIFKEYFLAVEHLGTLVYPYHLDGYIGFINGMLLVKSWAVHLGRTIISVPPQ